MDNSKEKASELSHHADEAIFEEAAARLKCRYGKRHGCEFKFGCFEFIFHDGRFQSIEERPRSKSYWSGLRLVTP